MKTFSLKSKQIDRKWHLLDASEAPLGRLATQAAQLLIGKGKPTLSHHMDDGDYVVIVNSKSLVVTGNKSLDKKYHRHSGYPGGLHTRTLQEQMQRDPAKVIEQAVKGMLPKNKLQQNRLLRLKIYNGPEHNNHAQKPFKIALTRGENS